MKITYEWLKEYVNVELTPRELAGKLTMLGFECFVEGKVNGEQVLDVEITANRPDCLCVLGLAREISAVTGTGLTTPEVKLIEDGGEVGEMVSVEIKTELCSRYCARVISGVKVDSSPEWLRRKLEAVGMRPINNIVDITNYVLMELGHPLHAFDYDSLQGKKIIVRCSRKGERFITLDEVERKLEPSMMVIADEKVPVALAGIMGGFETEVTGRTSTVLLEGAYFDASSVRRTSKHLQIETEASYRFQRTADIEGVGLAIDRAASLIREIAGGKAVKGMVDCYPRKHKKKEVCLRLSRLNRILGAELNSDYVSEQLRNLGFEKTEEDGKFTVTVPSFRRDIHREIDVIEEVARHYGYDRISPTIPSGRIPTGVEDKSAEAVEVARRMLASSGLMEVINHGLISEKWAKAFAPGNDLLKVRNPLTEEQSVMRSSLLPGLLRTLNVNASRGVVNVRVFEIGNVFSTGSGDAPTERVSVGAALTGFQVGDWEKSEKGLDFYDLKGVLENLLEAFGIDNWRLVPYEGNSFVPAQSAAVKIADSELGIMGKLKDGVKEIFDVEKDVYAFELDFEFLLNYMKGSTKFEAVPKYPASFRDIAVIVPEKVTNGDIVSAIRDEGMGIVENVELFDLYRGRQVPQGHKSMAYSIAYRAGDRTLTDDEVGEVHRKISERLVSEFEGRIRDE